MSSVSCGCSPSSARAARTEAMNLLELYRHRLARDLDVVTRMQR
jgi:hypothetical protein